jgi:hypothetical protein
MPDVRSEDLLAADPYLVARGFGRPRFGFRASDVISARWIGAELVVTLVEIGGAPAAGT